jgi:DNA-binding LytR/AlgR family response regulator
MKTIRSVERGAVHLVRVDDVHHMISKDKYTVLRTDEREFFVEETLVKFEAKLEGFIRIHRGCLVSVAHFDYVIEGPRIPGYGRKCFVVTTAGEHLPVSKRYRIPIKTWAEQNGKEIVRDDRVQDFDETPAPHAQSKRENYVSRN